MFDCVCVCVWGFGSLCYKHTWSITRFFSIDAVTLEATVRLTNIQFTADLEDASSQAYKNLTKSILAEVSVCLTEENAQQNVQSVGL